MDDFMTGRDDAPVEASFGEQQFFTGGDAATDGFTFVSASGVASGRTRMARITRTFALQAAPASNGAAFPASAAAATPASPPAASFTPAAAAPSEANPLIEFNKAFREQCEAKDAAEREARGARKATGKTALKKMLAERSALVEARKAKNREDEASRVRADAEALHGETWTRVLSLVDVHGSSPSAAAAASSETTTSRKGKSEEHVSDMARLKDVLIAVKNTPPAVPAV